MDDTPDKDAIVGKRLLASLAARGLAPTPEAGLASLKRLVEVNDIDTIIALNRESGITKEDYEAITKKCGPLREIDACSVALASSIAGGGIGAATAPLRQLVKDGRIGWKASAHGVPKSTALGAMLGGVVGIISAKITNSVHERRRQREGKQYQALLKVDWADEEAARRIASPPLASPGK
jgi:hypothetical protein